MSDIPETRLVYISKSDLQHLVQRAKIAECEVERLLEENERLNRIVDAVRYSLALIDEDRGGRR